MAVRQRELYCLIDTSRTSRKSGLKLFRPIRRKYEEYLGILFQSVHLVEQPIEKRLFTGTSHGFALTRDQIRVLYDDERGLKQSREAKICGKQSHLLGCYKQCRVLRKRTREVAHGVSFAGSWRAIEQQALFGRLAKRLKPAAMLGERKDVPVEKV